MGNQEKFAALREFNLPIGQYAITASGPLGIRNLREIQDIDLIVTPKLWDSLAEKYGVTDTGSVKKIVFPGQLIEAFKEGSFYFDSEDPNAPTVAERISDAEIIEGLPFDSLKHVLYFKHKLSRDKDLKDILLIETYLKEILDK
jgi:hypothetical protein